MSIPRTLLFAALLATTGLAGCFSEPQTDEPAFQISRSHAIDLDAESARALGETDGPEAFVRALVDTSLVVRVGQAGDYAISYQDEQGRARTETLAGLQPGQPRAVPGADPFSPAQLLRGAEVVASRAAIPAGWWQVGDLPLGVAAGSPASAAYDLRMDARAEVSLADVEAEEGMGRIDSLVARLAFPAKGALTWALAPDGVEERLDFSASLEVDDARGSLFFGEMTGEMEGQPGTVGAELRSGGAAADVALSMWLREGRLVAGQFQGASARADPDLVAWATGFAAENPDFPCAGKTREDACSPEQVQGFDETQPAGEREEIGEEAPRAEDAESREALRVLEALLATDVGLHDQLVVTFVARASDLGADAEGNDFDVRYLQEIKVAAKEAVTVPAGTFQAYRIVQTVGLRADVETLGSRSCAYWGNTGCESYETTTYLQDLHLDETLALTTIWLDAASYQPLKGTVEAPVDVAKVVRAVVRSVDEELWSSASLQAFDPEKLQFTTTTTASYEARSLTGDARFSPAVGFVLGSAMAGGFGGGAGSMMGLGGVPFGGPTRMEHAQPVPAPPYPSHSLSLASDGPIADGAKTYVVASASPGLSWSEIGVAVNGTHRSFAFGQACDAGMPFEFVVCHDGVAKTYRDVVEAGDTIRLPDVETGQTLQILHSPSNAVMMSLRVS